MREEGRKNQETRCISAQADTIGRQSTREEAADKQGLLLAECILGTTGLASLHFVVALVSLSLVTETLLSSLTTIQSLVFHSG